ncbi:MAG: hypothetical protein AVDCRST_MAG93-3230 [uncultured Chloroflexia bacterium]|uniref:Uncharacterized protein n=1 Tax=uncultured Chloroflexia bacterium TaxID=1672391 RepID=A0A6J4JLH8_9CHLR|nr:MAG: hypothetical protein AVDCRST_MAG93-3230 [uncultured Chloroflexia bacterium]
MTLWNRVVRHSLLIALALSAGFGIQLADRVIFSRALSRPVVIEEPFIFVWNALFTAMPMIALALQARQHLLAWLTGFAASAWLTWWWLQKGIAYQLNPDGSGVDMGGAMLMLFAPFVITAACLWLNKRLFPNDANGS